jgi:hypothetical protein
VSYRHRYRVGFAGIPAGQWNGWHTFRVTRHVMTTLIDDHHAALTQLIEESGTGYIGQAWLDAQQHLASLSWLGRLVIVDHRIRQHDPTAVEVISPDRDGLYHVGFGWSWDAVDPADVHTIHRSKDPTRNRPTQSSAAAGATARAASEREA